MFQVPKLLHLNTSLPGMSWIGRTPAPRPGAASMRGDSAAPGAQLLAALQLQAFQPAPCAPHGPAGPPASASCSSEPCCPPPLRCATTASQADPVCALADRAAGPPGAPGAAAPQREAQALHAPGPEPTRAAPDHEARIAQIEERLGGLLAAEGRQHITAAAREADNAPGPAAEPGAAPAASCPAAGAAPGRRGGRAGGGARGAVRHEATTQTEEDGRQLERLQVSPVG